MLTCTSCQEAVFRGQSRDRGSEARVHNVTKLHTSRPSESRRPFETVGVVGRRRTTSTRRGGGASVQVRPQLGWRRARAAPHRGGRLKLCDVALWSSGERAASPAAKLDPVRWKDRGYGLFWPLWSDAQYAVLVSIRTREEVRPVGLALVYNLSKDKLRPCEGVGRPVLLPN